MALCLDLVEANTYFMIYFHRERDLNKLEMSRIDFKQRCIGMKLGIENIYIYLYIYVYIYMCVCVFLTRPAVTIAVNKIAI